MKKFFSTLAMVLAAATCAQAQDLAEGQMWWGNYSNQQTSLQGNYKLGTYEVAMFVDGSADLKGVEIAGARMQTRLYSNAKDVTVWLRSSLDGENLIEKAVANPASSGWSSVVFDAPYALPETGVYVGYSFTLGSWYSDYDYTPVVYAKKPSTNGYFLKQPEETTFTDKSATGCVTTQVIISGDALKANAVSVADDIDDIVALAGTPIKVNVKVTNLGTAGVKTLGYTYTLDGKVNEGTIELAQPIGQMFNEQQSFDIELGAPTQLGMQEVEIKVGKVNGVDNQNTSSRKTKCTVNINVLKESAPRTAVAEIYVGPDKYYSCLGLVGSKNLREKMGDKVITIVAQHYNSALCVAPYKEYQQFADGSLRFTSYPVAAVNREFTTNPYYGAATAAPYHFESDKVIEPTLDAVTEGSVSAVALWKDVEAKDAVTITANATFTGDFKDAAYRLAFVVIADGFKQDFTNYVTYYKTNYPDDDLAEWRDGTYTMAGVTVDNMVVASTDVNGVSKSVPATIKAGEAYEYACELDLTQFEGQTPDNFRVVALLLNNNLKTVVNAVEVPVLDTLTGISEVNAETTVGCYNLNGMRVAAPAHGIFVMDGKKVILK